MLLGPDKQALAALKKARAQEERQEVEAAAAEATEAPTE
jgi:hypothetical protein